MSKTRSIAVAAALLLAAGQAMALGLGQIQVKSQRNQPLLAEIPIISVTPGELEALQARLASPETFRRVGLAPPGGAAADLQFSLGQDERGRPVIRVTTLQPLEQPLLNFLVEVEWGQGRLVREYSVALDTPQAMTAALQPAIQPAQAAEAAEAPVVQRPLPEASAAPPSPPSAEASTAAVPGAGAPAPAASAAPPPAATALPAQYGPVKHGETLALIAQRLRLAAGNRLDQAMLALLRANPDAFLGDDINRLRQGAVLRIPSATDIAAIPPEEAAQVVREQLRQWRQARRAVAQPTAATGADSAAAGSARAVPTPVAAAKPTGPAPAPAATPAAAAPRRAEARLQIVPPADGRPATATKTGNSAKGEGSMLQQELQRRDEEIAAKRAEIDELKDRVAALEKLKQEQARLLALKDSELAAAQQKLAAAASAPKPAQPAAAPAQAQPASHAAWWWGGAGLLAAIVLAWLLLRRRAPANPPPRRRLFDSDALAASLRPAAAATPASGSAPPPPWHAPTASAEVAAPPAAPDATSESMASGGEAAAPAAASAEHRFKLARAFLDIGDEHSARQLLTELLHDADPAAREDAARLLRELG